MRRDLWLIILAIVLFYLVSLWLGRLFAGDEAISRVAAKREEAVFLR